VSEKDIASDRRFTIENRKLVAVLVAGLLISIGVLGYLAVSSSRVVSNPLPVVEAGDLVYVDYVGYFTSNPGGWVFDTSEYQVAINESIIKSLFFKQRDPKEYTALNFTAGQKGQLLDPFEEAVMGMTVTQTKTILIPAEDAYPILYEQVVNLSIEQTISMKETISANDFSGLFDIEAYPGLQTQHYFWEWDVAVLDVSDNIVTYQNSPFVGQNISSYGNPNEDIRYGWYQQVISVDPSADGGEGLIVVRNLISSQDAYQKKGSDIDRRFFTLMAVDEDSGIFTINYNTEVYVGEISGRDLSFDITVSKVIKG